MTGCGGCRVLVLEGKSDAAALPALPVGPGKAHAALPLALLDGVARLLLQWL